MHIAWAALTKAGMDPDNLEIPLESELGRNASDAVWPCTEPDEWCGEYRESPGKDG